MKQLKSGRKSRRFDQKNMYILNLSDKSFFFYILFSVTQSFFVGSYEALIILHQATRKTHPKTFQCI